MGVSLCPIVSSSAKTANPLSLKKTQKILYIGGCRGVTVSGKKAGFLAHTNVRKLINGFDVKKYDITLKSANVLVASADSVNDCIYAEGIGETTVSVTVKDRETGKKVLKSGIKIIVRQNADKHSFIVEGIDVQKSLYDGDSLIISMPGTYTDKRVVICEDEGAEITPLEDGKSFEITFFDPGDYAILAAAYQSEKYNGYTAEKEFDVVVKEREAELHQTSADSVKLTGGPVDGDMEASEISVYEINDGIKVFYSYASKLSMDAHEAEICFFKPFASEKDYVLEYDGLEFPFTSAPCTVNDVASIKISEDAVRAGEENELSFRFYNKAGIDITSAVDKELTPNVRMEFADKEYFDGYISGRKLFFTRSGFEVKIRASLEIPDENDVDIRKLYTEKTIKSLPEKGTQFTGKVIYSVKADTGKYLLPGDECSNEIPIGDNVVLEALFEMDDGKYKNFKEAGITDIIVGDKTVAMIGKKTSTGGYKLILNNVGSTGIVAFRGEEAVGSFSLEVLPARKPAELKVELSKEYLNTNTLAEDYVMIKADMYDQYGAAINTSMFSIDQTEASKKDIGNVKFTEISKGRFVLNGYDCPALSEQRALTATVRSEGFERKVSICICDISYDPVSDDYACALKFDGSRLIDTALTLKAEAPKSTFVTVEISKGNYFVGEGIGYFFDRFPDVRHNASYYEVDPNTSFYGMSIEYTDKDGKSRYIGEDEECIIQSYSEIEFVPYTYQNKLPSGTYTVSVYHIKAGKEMSHIDLCDTETVIVLDSDPEIEVVQKLQSYAVPPENGWKEVIPQYFSFYYDEEDISGYITKVDCVEGSTGTVFVRSVEFLMSDPYFGAFTKTAKIERLITKQ